MGKSGWKKRLAAAMVVALLAGGGVFAWRQLKPAGLPNGFAVGNGRIEATEIDIATKAAGRIKEVLVNDGDVVEAGQVLARMNTQTLEASCVRRKPRSDRRSRPRLPPLPSWPNARVRKLPLLLSWPNARANWPWQKKNWRVHSNWPSK